MLRKRSRSNRTSVIMLAGWVFADIFLGLMMIFMISSTQNPLPAGANSGAATPNASDIAATSVAARALTPIALPSNTPSPTATPPPPTATPRPGESVSLKPVEFSVVVNADRLLGADAPGRASERASVAQQVRAVFAKGVISSNQIAGLVLTFGGSPSTSEGPALAKAVNDVLKSEFASTFGGATTRDYLDLGSPRGTVLVEVFVYASR